jgi:coenzyme F420-0:L-glutamate ligase / coenzyme F420-1:gamma-L-glutamate ligase
MADLRAIPIRGMGEILSGDSLADKILAALRWQKRRLVRGDILVVTHKIISKAEGQIVPLSGVKPSRGAHRWAKRHGLDPRVVELALSESRRIVRKRRGVLISETRHGLVCANSGVDLSNVDGGRSAVLLPRDPDRSARNLHRALRTKIGFSIPVIISDSFGRPLREGLCETAIGVAGMKVFRDFRGQRDPHGYRLRATFEAVADELACMAGLASGKLARTPACIIRGFPYSHGQGRAKELTRPAARDLFR